MTFVHDEVQNTSERVVVSTQAMTDEPIARLGMPQRISYGFPGTWIPT